MDNECGQKSQECICPECRSRSHIAIRVVQNPILECDSLGNPKTHCVIKECIDCFTKYYHHTCENCVEYWNHKIKEDAKNANK